MSYSYVEDAVASNSDADQAVCEKVGRSVRGLMNPGHDVMPHLSGEVAGCWQQIRPDDFANDVVDRKLRETKSANWCRTARSLIPLYISGKFQIPVLGHMWRNRVVLLTLTLTRLSFRNRDRRRTKTGTNHNSDPNRYRIEDSLS